MGHSGGTRAEVTRLEGHGEAVRDVAFSPNGRLIASGSVDRTVRLWDVTRGAEIRSLERYGAALCVAFSPDVKLVASGLDNSTVRLWDTAG
jgi:WD40 repeat protein